MPIRVLPVLAAALLLAAGPLGAQHRPATLPAAHAVRLPLPGAPAEPGEGTPVPLLVAGGFIGGTIGTFLGGVAGMYVACATRGDVEDCFLRGLVPGIVAGESVLLPLGVHIGNGRRGNYGYSLLASAGLGAAGWALLEITHYDPTPSTVIVTVTPLAQLAAAILVERHTARRR